MTRSKLIPILEALFAVTVWGASFIATKVALRDVSPITIVWLRFAMGVVILGIAVTARKQFALPKRNEWGYFALVGFLGITFHQWLQSTALITSQASTTAWIVATTPVFMALLGWLALKEKLHWLQTSGILLAGLGVLLVGYRRRPGLHLFRPIWPTGRYSGSDQLGQLGGFQRAVAAWPGIPPGGAHDVLRDDTRLVVQQHLALHRAGPARNPATEPRRLVERGLPGRLLFGPGLHRLV